MKIILMISLLTLLYGCPLVPRENEDATVKTPELSEPKNKNDDVTDNDDETDKEKFFVSRNFY